MQTNFAPVATWNLIGGNAQPLMIEQTQFVGVAAAAGVSANSLHDSTSGSRLVLRWTGPHRGRYAVETSPDLRHWTFIPADIAESESGRFEGRSIGPLPERAFFRVRQVQRISTSMATERGLER